jgi:hypothetical protein
MQKKVCDEVDPFIVEVVMPDKLGARKEGTKGAE